MWYLALTRNSKQKLQSNWHNEQLQQLQLQSAAIVKTIK
jgi:hypothetical protein